MTNPYASPESSDASAAQDERIARQIDKFAVIAWPIVFGLNMIVPAMLALTYTASHARFGMASACGLYLFLGWWLCLAKSSLARRVIVGSVVTALSQFIPVLQIIAGILAVAMLNSLGLAINDDAVGQVRGELGGFFATAVVGGLLIGCASVAGLIAGLVLPKRWMVMR